LQAEHCRTTPTWAGRSVFSLLKAGKAVTAIGTVAPQWGHSIVPVPPLRSKRPSAVIEAVMLVSLPTV
jgi:hypothetical protein